MSKLTDDICGVCRVHPSRGEKWALTARRVRTDKHFAKLVFSKIKTESGVIKFKELFGNMFSEQC